MVFTGPISDEKYAYARFLLEECDWPIRRVAKKVNISKSSAHRLKHRNINTTRTSAKKKGGRPCKLSRRDKRRILRCVEQLRKLQGYFTIEHLMQAAAISTEYVSSWTVRRYLKKEGIYYFNARQKGLLNEADMRKRVIFAKRVRRDHPKSIWTDGIAFYLDGVTFVYKTCPHEQTRAPRKRVWRRRSEGLKPGCVAKGRKEGTGLNVLRFMVAIAYGKGVIVCEQYDKLNGAYFADFITRNFVDMFGAADKDHVDYFVQDGDRSQNSKVAEEAMKRVKAQVFKIPAKSPDLNPIKNMFHIANRELRKSSRTIDFETREEFATRIRQTLHSIPIQTMDKTIASMDKRIGMVIKARGQRIKY
jgi:transposase